MAAASLEAALARGEEQDHECKRVCDVALRRACRSLQAALRHSRRFFSSAVWRQASNASCPLIASGTLLEASAAANAKVHHSNSFASGAAVLLELLPPAD